MQTKKKMYPAVDVMKILCALVILLYHFFSEHGPVFWLLEEALSLYAVAVALFMTLSGFLLFEKLKTVDSKAAQWQIVKGQVRRIITIYLLWSIPYLAFQIFTWDWQMLTVLDVFWKVQGWVFGSTFYTIWFMPALAVGMLFAWYLYSHLKWGTVCAVATLFFLGGMLQSTYGFVGKMIPGFSFFSEFSATWLQGSRGGIFYGMPLIILGALASKIQWRNLWKSAALSIAMMALLLTEAILLRRFVGGCGLDLAFFMMPLCLMLTLFLTSVPWSPSGKGQRICRWLRAMSVLIFMTQRLFLTVIPSLVDEHITRLLFSNPYIGACLFCGVTIAFSAGVIAFSKKWKGLRYLY